MDKKKVQQYFVALMNSCVEGYTGEWNPTGEGAGAFTSMYDQLMALAEHFKVDVSKAKDIYDNQH